MILDKVVLLTDVNEEFAEPGGYLTSWRKEYKEGEISIENEMQVMEGVSKVLKEQYSEEIVKEVCVIGSIEEVF